MSSHGGFKKRRSGERNLNFLCPKASWGPNPSFVCVKDRPGVISLLTRKVRGGKMSKIFLIPLFHLQSLAGRRLLLVFSLWIRNRFVKPWHQAHVGWKWIRANHVVSGPGTSDRTPTVAQFLLRLSCLLYPSLSLDSNVFSRSFDAFLLDEHMTSH